MSKTTMLTTAMEVALAAMMRDAARDGTEFETMRAAIDAARAKADEWEADRKHASQPLV